MARITRYRLGEVSPYDTAREYLYLYLEVSRPWSDPVLAASTADMEDEEMGGCRPEAICDWLVQQGQPGDAELAAKIRRATRARIEPLLWLEELRDTEEYDDREWDRVLAAGDDVCV
jgi:hypothetical protein